tara:strand:- start:20298 stop:20546 length:249 start_codon:yes stop_codon:yes gene_type:complete
MVEYDNSKTFLEFELKRKIDKQKERGLSKNSSDIRVMDNLMDALHEYVTRFGKESNVYAECVLLYAQINKNKKKTKEYMDLI